MLRGLAAEDVEPDDIAGVIVEEADQVGVLAAQAEGEDVGLPELVRRGPLEGPGHGRIVLRLRPALLEQGFRVEGAAHRLPAHREEQDAPEELADLLDPEIRVAPLQGDGLPLHRGGHLGLPVPRLPRLPLQARLALRAIGPDPLPQRAQAYAEVAGDLRDREAFLHTELDRFTPELHRMGVRVQTTNSPPPLPPGSFPLPLNLAVPVHGFHSFRVLFGPPGIGVSPIFLTSFRS